jgi:hypothetical protein
LVKPGLEDVAVIGSSATQQVDVQVRHRVDGQHGDLDPSGERLATV